MVSTKQLVHLIAECEADIRKLNHILDWTCIQLDGSNIVNIDQDTVLMVTLNEGFESSKQCIPTCPAIPDIQSWIIGCDVDTSHSLNEKNSTTSINESDPKDKHRMDLFELTRLSRQYDLMAFIDNLDGQHVSFSFHQDLSIMYYFLM